MKPIRPAGSDAGAAVSSGPGQCGSRIPAVAEQRESLQAKAPGLPAGPAETGPAGPQATDQGDDVRIIGPGPFEIVTWKKEIVPSAQLGIIYLFYTRFFSTRRGAGSWKSNYWRRPRSLRR